MNSSKKSVLVKHAYGNVYDAFWDQGWTNWTRFLFRKGEVIYIKGQYINKQDTELLQEVVKKMLQVNAEEKEAA